MTDKLDRPGDSIPPSGPTTSENTPALTRAREALADVVRYALIPREHEEAGNIIWSIEPHKNGQYVLYSDYAALSTPAAQSSEGKREMVCEFCGHETQVTSIGAVYCGPHKLSDGTYYKAVAMRERAAPQAALSEQVEPIPMVLHCPNCGWQHIDSIEIDGETVTWNNPPHRSHLCENCGCIWRPADVATTGVSAINTKGSDDNFAGREQVERGGVTDAYVPVEHFDSRGNYTVSYEAKVDVTDEMVKVAAEAYYANCASVGHRDSGAMRAALEAALQSSRSGEADKPAPSEAQTVADFMDEYDEAIDSCDTDDDGKRMHYFRERIRKLLTHPPRTESVECEADCPMCGYTMHVYR